MKPYNKYFLESGDQYEVSSWYRYNISDERRNISDLEEDSRQSFFEKFYQDERQRQYSEFKLIEFEDDEDDQEYFDYVFED